MTITKDIVNNDITLIFNGGDSITLNDFLLVDDSSSNYTIEEFQFADGISLTLADIYNMIDINNGTTGDDTIDTNDGEHYIYGNSGSDTYIFNLSDGNKATLRTVIIVMI